MESSSEERIRPYQRIKLILMILLAVAVGILIYWSRKSVPVPLEERSRNELVLQDGHLFELGSSNLFSGIVFDLYDGGETKSRSIVADGLLQGLSQGWWSNGVLQVSEHFSNSISHGERTKYYNDGSTQSVANIVNGKIEGTFRRWYENGKLEALVQMTNGLSHGESLAYHPDGSLKAKVLLNHGEVAEQQFWEPGEQPMPSQATQ